LQLLRRFCGVNLPVGGSEPLFNPN
jgi:hypothetical protein